MFVCVFCMCLFVCVCVWMYVCVGVCVCVCGVGWVFQIVMPLVTMIRTHTITEHIPDSWPVDCSESCPATPEESLSCTTSLVPLQQQGQEDCNQGSLQVTQLVLIVLELNISELLMFSVCLSDHRIREERVVPLVSGSRSLPVEG